MKRLDYFAARHKVLAFIGITAFLCCVYTVFFGFIKMPVWLIIVFDIAFVIITLVYVIFSASLILQKAIKKLDDECDPYPLYEATSELLTYKNSAIIKRIILINYALALRACGEYEKNLDILKSLDAEKVAELIPEHQVLYYNNLMDAHGKLEQYAEAQNVYSKMMSIYQNITEEKILKTLESVIQSAEIFHIYCEKDYEKVILLLKDTGDSCKKNKMDSAMLYAKAAIAVGDVNIAKEKLQYVIKNGNKLYVVKEAQQILSKLC